jgi:hypothetical protein
MIKDYKVAYPSGMNLKSQMFDDADIARKFASGKPFSMTMKLQEMDGSGAYTWSIESIGMGWVFMVLLIVFFVFF